MDDKALEKRIAFLEFANDQLSTEIEYIDSLLKLIGFERGLSTIKDVAREVLEEENE